jgi:hypothetical protein
MVMTFMRRKQNDLSFVEKDILRNRSVGRLRRILGDFIKNRLKVQDLITRNERAHDRKQKFPLAVSNHLFAIPEGKYP